MRIVDHDELSSASQQQVHLLDMTAGWGALDFSDINQARKMGYPATDYFGIYAVEGGEVLSAVRVIRFPFTTPNGVGQVAGVQGVVTRRDTGRKGLARKLLEEVHRREEASGKKFAMLWTGRSMVAHGLYEKLGYVDVYSPELAIRRIPRNTTKPTGYRLRKARRDDFRPIERLHAEATKGRLGFTPRTPRYIEIVVQLGFASLEGLMVIEKRGEPVGYAQMQKVFGLPRVEELFLLSDAEPDQVLSLLEVGARGGWCAFRNTTVRDHLGLLKARGYAMTNLAYYGLLAKPLDGGRHDMALELGTTSPRFTCQAFDYF